MDKAELLSTFTARVDEFEKYQNFIHKAQSQSGKFAPAVVEKVIKDNTEKSLKVVEEIIPLMGDVEEVIGSLSRDRQNVLDGRQTSQFALEELELRLAIGEMDQGDFDREASDLKAAVSSIDGKVATIDEELHRFKSVMDRWQALGQQSGVMSPKKAAPPEPPPEPPKAKAVTTQPTPVVEAIEADAESEEAFSGELDNGAHAEKVKVTEDLSDVLGGNDDEAEDDIPESDKGLDVGELDVLGDDDGLEMEAGGSAAPTSEEPRRAVLLYQEGTAEEQIYPFNGDQITLGRGRDNDIQVKNDSKVSRYHCKLYRRGPNFYIEDNKSANGTLVNGELITERRLFGGEEIIIGETFFRFRIMD